MMHDAFMLHALDAHDRVWGRQCNEALTRVAQTCAQQAKVAQCERRKRIRPWWDVCNKLVLYREINHQPSHSILRWN